MAIWEIFTQSPSSGAVLADLEDYTLGALFSASANGTITHLIYYIPQSATLATTTVRLWGLSNPVALVAQSFTPVAKGVQTVSLATAYSISAGGRYIVSHHYNRTNHSVYWFLAPFTYPVTNGPLVAVGGMYLGATGVPTTTAAEWYGNDVYFDDGGGAGTATPAMIMTLPILGAGR